MLIRNQILVLSLTVISLIQSVRAEDNNQQTPVKLATLQPFQFFNSAALYKLGNQTVMTFAVTNRGSYDFDRAEGSIDMPAKSFTFFVSDDLSKISKIIELSRKDYGSAHLTLKTVDRDGFVKSTDFSDVFIWNEEEKEFHVDFAKLKSFYERNGIESMGEEFDGFPDSSTHIDPKIAYHNLIGRLTTAHKELVWSLGLNELSVSGQDGQVSAGEKRIIELLETLNARVSALEETLNKRGSDQINPSGKASNDGPYQPKDYFEHHQYDQYNPDL